MVAYKRTVGGKHSNLFVPIPEGSAPRAFGRIVDALLADDVTAAAREIAALEAQRIMYTLVRCADGGGKPIWGFLECVRPGTPNYRGWGAALVRPGANQHTVYQAPHPQSDSWTDNLAFDAFVADPHASVVLFAGTNRYANGREPATADVAHTTDNLFHLLTVWLATRGYSAGRPFWFVQLHGSSDRQKQPMITISNGTFTPHSETLAAMRKIERRVQAQGYLTIGVCGDKQANGRTRSYLLCGTGNAQGDLLERLDLRHTFLHCEIAESVRTAYRREDEPSHSAIHHFLAAVRDVLGEPPAVRSNV